ncbi:N-acetyl-alpha-D-glucosaminyl L-malate synthase BshA [soil metagenome]
MKIGIVCAPTYGGSGVVATELGRFLCRRGHEVHVISTAMPFRLEAAQNENIFFHEVQAVNYPVLPGDLMGIAIAGITASVAQDYDLDIVHAHYAIPHAISAWIARVASPNARFKVVTTLHGTDITLIGKAPSFFPIAKFAMENSDAVTTVSNWLKEETYKEFGITKEIHVIPNFVDEKKFMRGRVGCKKSYYAPNGEKIMMHISNFRAVKRIPDVLRVFDLVQKQIPAKLIMIGDGPERDVATVLARELRIMQHVHFLGKQEFIENFLSCSDVMIFPSEYESFGLAALEAMASENAVITSNGGGLPDLITHGVDGYMANVGDVEAMAKYAVEILSDDVKRREMGRKARETALSKYHPDQIVPIYERLYESVIDQKK